jgi:hypothetical protein
MPGLVPGIDIELHVVAALVPDEPAFGEPAVEGCPVLADTAAGLQERRVDELRLDCVCDSTNLRAATSGSAKGRGSTNLMLSGLHVRGVDVAVHVVEADRGATEAHGLAIGDLCWQLEAGRPPT